MLKTIKTTKQMRLDELIKYVQESNDDIYNGESIITFKSKDGHIAEFVSNGTFQSDYWFDFEDTFPVEVEEPITEDTKLTGVQEVYMDKDEQRIEIESFSGRYSINEILDEHDVSTDSLQIYALIDGRLELVWERDEG